MEELLRKIPGVVETRSATPAAPSPAPTYDDVKTGTTGHAESVRIVFDPERLSYEELLDWFFRMHDPTTRNRQGNDVGTQYRSAIFSTTDEQREDRRRGEGEVDASGKWKRPVVTEIVPAGDFWQRRGLPPGLPARRTPAATPATTCGRWTSRRRSAGSGADPGRLTRG